MSIVMQGLNLIESSFKWRTGDFREIPLSEMEFKHLTNSIAYLTRKDEVANREKISILTAELVRRLDNE